ncbi:MAG: HDOD domain-containing protein [Aquificota bacterium]|nr:HDOD domain-containing protein [Aquificota bacterium]
MDLEAKRQAIADREGERVGYEFFLISHGKADLSPEVLSNKTTFITVRTLAEYGVKKVGEGKRVFVKIPIDTLLVKVLDLLDSRTVAYKIHPPVVGMGKTVYTRSVSYMEKLKSEGVFISVHADLIAQYDDLVQIADMVEFDARRVDLKEVHRLRDMGVKVLITGIDSGRYYNRFRSYADCFQGDYIDEGMTLEKIRIAPYLKSTLLRLLVLLNTAQSPTEFAKVIETDVGMSAKLLRFVNSAFFSLRKKIASLDQAAIYFGLKNLRNFVLVLSMNDYATVKNPVAWRRSLIRARIMEELSKAVNPDLSSEAYMVGLFSLIDLILGVGPLEFLKEVNADETVLRAFEDKSSPLAKLLEVASLLEDKEREIIASKDPLSLPVIRDVASGLGLSGKDVLEILKGSCLMADTIIHL